MASCDILVFSPCPHHTCLSLSSCPSPAAPLWLPFSGCPSPTRGTLLPLAGRGTAKRPTRIWFSSVRQGHQRQPPTGHSPRLHSVTGNIISVVNAHGAPRTQQARQALLEQSPGTPGSCRSGHAREARTDSGWTAGWVWPCRQPHCSGS